MNRYRCNNGCKYQMASKWVCQHPNAVGRDGDGVGLTEYEKEHVLRMGCASHSDFQNQRERVLEHIDEILKHEWANATNLDNPYRDDRHMVISRIRNTVAIYRKELRQVKE